MKLGSEGWWTPDGCPDWAAVGVRVYRTETLAWAQPPDPACERPGTLIWAGVAGNGSATFWIARWCHKKAFALSTHSAVCSLSLSLWQSRKGDGNARGIGHFLPEFSRAGVRQLSGACAHELVTPGLHMLLTTMRPAFDLVKGRVARILWAHQRVSCAPSVLPATTAGRVQLATEVSGLCYSSWIFTKWCVQTRTFIWTVLLLGTPLREYSWGVLCWNVYAAKVRGQNLWC